MTVCRCMTPPFDFKDYDCELLGIDETNDRFGQVSVQTCQACGRKWVHYFVEYEAFSNSGRWYRGPVTPEMQLSLRPNWPWPCWRAWRGTSTAGAISGPPAARDPGKSRWTLRSVGHDPRESMKLAAFQFRGSGNIEENLLAIQRGILKASEQNVRFLLTQECALVRLSTPRN